ncbi:GDP-mannose 4,6-dehydratase [Gammaproteobacteria bacterium]|nr:GDP-mannose 4,6-dehydratase [Gammaproteobacteria bacterium]
MKKIALITGISGQDGSYLAKFLLSKGYEVWGTSRDAQGSNFFNLKKLDIFNKVKLISMLPEDFRSVLVALQKSLPDEVYNLAGQSSVSLSFDQPVETVQSITIGTLNLLESSRMLKKSTRVYYAGSSEIFGNTNGVMASEKQPFHPQSPYGVAKASAFWMVDNYRNAYNLFACTGILFNHESPLRPKRFVTQKIISSALRVAKGSDEVLELGRLDISRDWGWAPEYVEAMWLMLQQDSPEDYIVATGETNTLESFVSETFDSLGLDWKKHVRQEKKFMRPTDIEISVGDASKAYQKLGWKPKNKMKEVISLMLEEHNKKA